MPKLAFKWMLFLIAVVSAPPRVEAGVLLQGFYWDAPSSPTNSWWNQIGDKAPELARSGFTAIWLPPALKSAGGGYSVGYDPFDDYDLGKKDQRGTIPTRWGSKTELVTAVAKLRANGFDVYLDFVLAHRNGDDGNKNFQYVNALGQWPGGRFPKSSTDFLWDNSVFGRALNYGNDNVRRGIIEAGQWQVETLGSQGIRIDHAKGVPADFLGRFFSAGSLSRQFAFVEYWEENVDALISYLSRGIANRASAFDFALWGKLKEMGNARGFYNMRNLQGGGFAGRNAAASVTFVENHDTERSWPTLYGKQLGYAYILTSEGYPSVFWKDYYVYGLKGVIDNLVWIHERLASGSTVYRWADDDLLIYERQGGAKLLVGLNDNASNPRREWVSTNFGGNVELQDYTGQHPNVRTAQDGRVQIEIRPSLYAAYAPVGFGGGLPPRAVYSVTQVFRGADDLDIPAAQSQIFTTVETLTFAANTNVSWWLDLESIANPDVEVQTVGANGKATVIFKGRGNSVNGQFVSTTIDTVKLEVRVRADRQPRVPFKMTVQYLAPK